jgi:hypothetical protein
MFSEFSQQVFKRQADKFLNYYDYQLDIIQSSVS